jgi:hypothetical protein
MICADFLAGASLGPCQSGMKLTGTNIEDGRKLPKLKTDE